MQTDILIIGQGICGTFLSYYLQKAGLSFIIIDEQKLFTASKAAAGIINPVTGRRIVNTWMIDELLPFVKNVYQQIESETAINCFSQKNIVDFFPSPQMRNAFLDRFKDDNQYLKLSADEKIWLENFNYDFGFGEIEPAYLIDVRTLLSFFRKRWIDDNLLLEEHFNIDHLHISENKISYKDIVADKIIFCDGMASFSNPYFQNLPFAPNKGEALIIEIKEFPSTHIFKKGINIVPWKGNLFWIGSSYEWKFNDDKPSENFRRQTESLLRSWMKNDFTVIEHFSSVRSATLERRPFVGFHPIYKNIGLLNGMGTKGCSLAPFFARQFVEHIINNSPLHKEANVQRFNKILSRK